jgi:hypothetical protein
MDGHSCLPDPGLQVTLFEGCGVLCWPLGSEVLKGHLPTGRPARRGSRLQAQVIENPLNRRLPGHRGPGVSFAQPRRIGRPCVGSRSSGEGAF